PLLFIFTLGLERRPDWWVPSRSAVLWVRTFDPEGAFALAVSLECSAPFKIRLVSYVARARAPAAPIASKAPRKSDTEAIKTALNNVIRQGLRLRRVMLPAYVGFEQ